MKDPFPVRGKVVRLFYNPYVYTTATDKFYDLMQREGSAVSRAGTGAKIRVHQIPDVYYWRGAVLTHGGSEHDSLIEVQKDGILPTVDELVLKLESEMQVKFRKRTVSRS